MGKWVFFEALSKGGLAVLQPDICHAGGITECRKIAALGEAAFAKVALHCPLSPLSLAASVQLDACIPNFLVQEHNEVNDWREGSQTVIGKGYLREPFVLDGDGCVQVPQSPGLGVELDDDGMMDWRRSCSGRGRINADNPDHRMNVTVGKLRPGKLRGEIVMH